MKRILALAAIITLAGCGGTTYVTLPAATTTVPAGPSSSSIFLDAINGEDANIATAAGGDSGLLLLANEVCQNWAHGLDAAEVVQDGIEGVSDQIGTSYSTYQIGEIIGVATTTICPLYAPQLHTYLVANGDAT